MGEEKRASGGVIKFPSVVTLHTFDGGGKLSADISKEVGKGGKSVRFKTKRKGPQKMRTVIENNQIVFVARHADDGRCP